MRTTILLTLLVWTTFISWAVNYWDSLPVVNVGHLTGACQWVYYPEYDLEDPRGCAVLPRKYITRSVKEWTPEERIKWEMGYEKD